MKDLTPQEAWNKITAYCSAAERCRLEVTEKLKAWSQPHEVTSAFIEKLEEENYLNEERYCESFVHDKFNFNKWGKKKIAQALYFKNIPASISTKYLARLDEEEYSDLLMRLLENKLRTTKAKDDYELKGKLVRFALGRGFEYEEISRGVEALLRERERE